MVERHPREEETERRGPFASRRQFLAATGVAGIAGASGFALAQQDGPTFELGGATAGWEGRAPAEIEGQTNPTLLLQAGTEYEVVWENVDGAPHDFVIDTEGGEVLVESDTLREEGETTSVTFTASEEMNRYVCTFHPASMAGDVRVTSEDEGDGQQTPTPTPQQRYVPEGPTVGAQLVADGALVNPVNLRTVPGMDDTHLVADQAGYIYVLEGGELREEPFLDVSDDIAFLDDREGGFDERGFLGFDFHPDFAENGQFYVRYSSLEPVSDGDGLVGPGDREFPESWDHVEVLSEFQVADAPMATPAGGDGATNATQAGGGNQTGTPPGNATEAGTPAGNETQAGTPAGDGVGTQTPAGDGAQLQADPDSERVLLEVPEPQFNHNGGEVIFGPDGYLYTSLGDGGGANDTGEGHVEDWYDGNDGGNGQDVTDNLLGSILRIDVDGEAADTPEDGGGDADDEEGEGVPYAVPDDNPLVDTDGMDEIYAWGLRNPWRMSFNDDTNTETLITADVGQALFEEVHVVESGGNYGWNVREGFHCFNAADATMPLDDCPSTAPDESPYDGQDLADPVLEYPHTYQGTPVGISITGGYVYPGEELADLAGQYVFGDWSANFAQAAGRVFVATRDGAGGEAGDGTATETAATETPGTETPGMGTPGTETNETGTPGTVADNGTATATEGEEGTPTETAAPVEEQVDLQLPDEQPWTYEEVLFEGGENQQLNRFVQAFGRDADGNLYVLASRTGRLTSEAGEVWQLVPAGEGDEISQPEPPETPAGDGENGDEGTNETAGNGGDGNVTTGNGGNGNETIGNGGDGNATAAADGDGA